MTKSTNSKNIVLASSSPYRKELLSRVLNDFSCESPDIDETPFPDEEPVEHVARLAEQKAMTVSLNHPDSIIIGSDQICVLGGQILGKPHTETKAIEQLQACSGKTVIFYTSLCVLESGQQAKTIDVVVTEVSFRVLEKDEIERYVQREQPLDCAGSFKCEGLGIALFESLSSKDPTALIGLPLITLAQSLRKLGVQVI
ncbi:Maf family protein [Kangiella geojedonensis]|uniref:7-methyl-GTP pyrophosphatase n=1 Tax=Kangiella geojedonensis TaxID=914150 RepID=A0A0F6TQ95_9GAMM|nr:Maf family protein [Kangiella geojedonensis]AKE52004.1 septum formation protein Maf [Kangiella geojedonensis]